MKLIYNFQVNKSFERIIKVLLIVVSLLLQWCLFLYFWSLPTEYLKGASGDITWMHVINQQKLIWTYPWTMESFNPFFGMTSTWTLVNPWLFPSEIIKHPYLLKAIFNGNHFIAYVLGATIQWFELAVGIVYLARVAGCSWAKSLIAFQLGSVAVYAHLFNIGFNAHNAWLCPMIMHLYMIAFIFLGLYIQLGVNRRKTDLFILLSLPGICLLGLFSFLSHFSTLILSLAPFGIVILLMAREKRHILFKTLAAGIVGILLVLVYPYISSSADYTSRRFFPNEIVDNQQNYDYVGIFFKSPVLFWIIASGILYSLRAKSKNLVMIAVGSLVHMGLMLVIGYCWLFTNINWAKFPSPHYIEQPVYPIYLIAAISGWSIAFSEFKQFLSKISYRKLISPHGLLKFTISILITPLILCSLYLGPGLVDRLTMNLRLYRPVPIADQWTRTIEKELRLEPGSEFNGSIASIFKTRPHYHLIFWPRWATQWNEYNIPSFEEYSQTLTPQLYFFSTRFLWPKLTYFHRNNIKVVVPNIKLLSMLGVRMIITDRKIPGQQLVKSEKLPETWVSMFSEKELKPIYHYLYRIPGTNIGNYSPTKVLHRSNITGMLDVLYDSRFNPKIEVISNRKLKEDFVQAEDSIMKYNKGVVINIRATSSGRSILVLPVQFSNCLKVENLLSTPEQPEIFTANLMQTGIVFENKLNANLKFEYGLFNAGCRIQDIENIKDLKIKSNSKPLYVSEFHPYYSKDQTLMDILIGYFSGLFKQLIRPFY